MSDDKEISAVSLKLPTFWPQQPKVWFAQVEAQFAIRSITKEETKYHYVISALDQETAVRVLDLLETTPTDSPYETLKKRLIGSFSLSEYERAHKLLHLPQLGDEKPSSLLDQMLGLLGKHPPCFIFKQIFLERLPERIRSVLVHSDISDMRQLAEAADRLHSSLMQEAASEVHKVSTRRPSKEKITKPGLCFYHARFGSKAKRCVAPCNWSENGTAGPQ